MKDENEGRSQDDGHCPKCGDDEGCCCALDGMLVVHPDKIEKLEQENKELRTRVAEQKKLIEWHKTDTHDAMEWKNEFQNRLSTLNAEIEGNGGYKDMLKGFQFKIESLESRLSTLLKASEGMEKALEEIAHDVGGGKTGCEAWMENRAKQAIADFRAVKEAL